MFSNIICQNKSYSAKTLKLTNPYSLSKEGTPLGKNIKLTYDSFFKKYDLTYTNVDNGTVKKTIKFCDGCTKNNTNELLYNGITDDIKNKKRIAIHLVGNEIYIFDAIVLLK